MDAKGAPSDGSVESYRLHQTNVQAVKLSIRPQLVIAVNQGLAAMANRLYDARAYILYSFMLLKLTLRRTGNSVGLVLPKEALEHIGAAEGDAVFLTFLPEGALRLSTADSEFEGKVQAAEKIHRQYGDAIRALIRRSI